MESTLATSSSAAGPVTFSHVFGQQCQLMEAGSALSSVSQPWALLWAFLTSLGSSIDTSPFLQNGKLGVSCSLTLCQPSCYSEVNQVLNSFQI
ncbi:hypothetical protein FD755_003328 [Muntiacus reevesi]|uniref:Uncharacterized protein n=1 Tax=Muntiacus reevesi TaxID=9886 RepID=A0A5J5N866_MUNRE|nr:hypothetical protein FD755_003328 [Muntiacus reevesi]